MASKKYYAVKKGKTKGIFTTWDECKASVEGYSGAVYKSFANLEEAEDYIMGNNDKQSTKCGLLAYVDGSYNDSIKKYAFGCVFLLPDGRIYTECGSGDNEESLQHRNVTGEMLGAMYAVRCAMASGYDSIEIRYDYEGIEKWVTGAWKSKQELTSKYAASMREWEKKIKIKFTKVAAHTNVKYNELADQLAKSGLTRECGIPKVRKIEELTVYEA